MNPIVLKNQFVACMKKVHGGVPENWNWEVRKHYHKRLIQVWMLAAMETVAQLCIERPYDPSLQTDLKGIRETLEIIGNPLWFPDTSWRW